MDNEEIREMNKEENKMQKMRNKENYPIVSFVMTAVALFVIGLCIKNFIIFTVYIPSASMVPTLNEGDYLLVTKVYDLENIERGDILVFQSEELNDVLIKRVIGLPGDVVTIVGGKVSVNDEELKEDYVVSVENSYGQYQVPEGKYFFLGDNRDISYDSSKWINPYIDGKDIEAKAQIKIFPFNDFGFLK